MLRGVVPSAPSRAAAIVVPPARVARLVGAAATLWLAIGCWWVVYWRAAWKVPGLSGLLLALGGAQIALHWALGWAARSRARLAAYFLAQSALIAAFGRLGGSDPWMYQLSILLLAEAVIVLRSPRAQVAAAVVQVAGAAGAAVVLFGPWTLARALMHSIPMAVSIAGFGLVFRRLAQSEAEARAALEALDAAHRRLVLQAGELEQLTLAAERQRLARELHDTLAQGLVGLTLQLEALDAHLGRGEVARSIAIVRGAAARARSTLGEARTAIADLREGAVTPLAEALREEAERFSGVTGIPCTLTVAPALSLGGEAAQQAIRCVAEGLTNVARHARARHASISVSRDDDAVVLELADDGVGFETGAPDVGSGHYGLLGIEERARLAGGRLEIRSHPGAGTLLRLRLPSSGGGEAA